MAKIRFNVKGVDAAGQQFEPPKPGMYVGQVAGCTDAKPEGKDRRLEVVIELTEGDFRGARLWTYINLESEAAAFRLREFLEAVGLVTDGKETGTLDTDKIVGTPVQVRVKGETWNDEYRAKVANLLPLDAGEESDEEDEDLDEESEDEASDEEINLDELSRAELKALIKDEELEIKVVRSMSDDDIRAAIEEAFGEADEEEPEDEEDEGDDLEDLSRVELKKVIKDEGHSIKVVRSMSDEDIAEAIRNARGDDEEDEPEDDEEDETADYESWSLAELKAELETRSLKTTGRKNILVARLQKHDETNDNPFEDE